MNADSRTRRAYLRTFPRFALACVFVAPVVSASETDGRMQEVHLTSGAKLIGEVKGHQPDGEWVLASPDALDPVRLKPEAVQTISVLAGGDPAENQPAATLVFLSGNRIPADIVSFDGSAFEVRVPWATESRSVPWKCLQRVVFAESGAKRIFAGPSPDQKWQFTLGPNHGNREAEEENDESTKRGTWRLEDGALTADGPGSASVDANLSDQVSITYDLEWTGMLSMSMGMFSDSFLPFDKEQADGPTVAATAAKNGEVIPLREGIAIDLNQHSVILRAHSPEQGQDMLGSGQLPAELRARTHARVTVRIDRAAGLCGVWFGDKLVQKWTELGNLGGAGKGLSFWQHHNNGTVDIRRLVVRTWNGKFEEEAPAAEEERDILAAADGTRITGKLGAMKSGQFAMETSVGPIDVPMGELRHLVRATGKEEKSEKNKPVGATITLAAGTGRFHVEGFRVESDGRLFIGRHAELGELSLPAAEVDSVDFRPDGESDKDAGASVRKSVPGRQIILPGVRGNPGARQIIPLQIPGLKK
ncbi:MAG: hypothetical protein ACKO2G_03765 [Verrucomicrobiales bacterium]